MVRIGAATALEGLHLAGGWSVGARIEPAKHATGGHFSVGYVARHVDGRTGFLKAQDLSPALEHPDLFRAIEDLTAAFNFERDILKKCLHHRMNRVVTAIDEGAVEVAGYEPPLSHVRYLIFERADGDVRSFLGTSDAFDLAGKLRSLHHVATGLQQLHARGIAHQDLKPSNVLVFEKTESKIADLGRACDRLVAGPWDDLTGAAGDLGYAPPELLYGHQPADWETKRLGCDAYLLGSLVVFFFSGVTMTAALISFLAVEQHWRRWGDGFEAVMPFLRAAFEQAISNFEDAAQQEAPTFSNALAEIARQLCEPDPRLRGHPRSRGNVVTQFDLQRYVSRFDLLARSAELLYRRRL
jgi:serine/threonine protein kinase